MILIFLGPIIGGGGVRAPKGPPPLVYTLDISCLGPSPFLHSSFIYYIIVLGKVGMNKLDVLLSL
jgi:hypothetical protein